MPGPQPDLSPSARESPGAASRFPARAPLHLHTARPAHRRAVRPGRRIVKEPPRPRRRQLQPPRCRMPARAGDRRRDFQATTDRPTLVSFAPGAPRRFHASITFAGEHKQAAPGGRVSTARGGSKLPGETAQIGRLVRPCPGQAMGKPGQEQPWKTIRYLSSSPAANPAAEYSAAVAPPRQPHSPSSRPAPSRSSPAA